MSSETDKKLYYCEKCNRTKRGDDFYTSNNLEKYPNDGKMSQCKDCQTMFVDNWNPETFLWILQEMDVPYIPDEWNKLLASYGKDPSKVTGKTIIGRYLSKMKLKQFRDYRWSDTEYLQKVSDNKIEQAMKRQGFGAAEIDQALKENKIVIPEEGFVEPKHEALPEQDDYQQMDYFDSQNGFSDEDIAGDLTDEDKLALRIKWGKAYKPAEWVELEKLFQEMMASYDITAAGDINTLKLACKASLKANQLLDLGDIDGAQKMAKVYENLMKSGKWTAAQNKAEENDAFDSIGEIVALCEKEGFIPRYYIEQPNDKADRVIQDNQIYVKELVTGELGLGNLIENAVKAIEDEKAAIKDASVYAEGMEDKAEDALFDYDSKNVIEDSDFEEFSEFEEDWERQAEKVYKDQDNN